MQQHIDYKVPGGKLVRIDADVEEGYIKDIHITGDFFMHPEESIAEVEASLRHQMIGSATIAKQLVKALKKTEMVGISVQELLNALDKFKS